MNTNILAIRIAFFLLTKYCQHKPSITFLGILIESYFGQEVILIWLSAQYAILLIAQSVLIHFGELDQYIEL